MGPVHRVLSQSEARPESFHDCRVQALRWDADQIRFCLDMHYILEWLEPDGSPDSGYKFRVAEARLVFDHAHDVCVSMDWGLWMLYAAIESLELVESRPTPSGVMETKFELDFSNPSALISVWSTGYRVVLLSEPVVVESQDLDVPPLECGGPADLGEPPAQ